MHLPAPCSSQNSNLTVVAVQVVVATIVKVKEQNVAAASVQSLEVTMNIAVLEK
jgi:hypothetical protein